MFKPPKIITDENERFEADCNAAAKRRWWATPPVRELAEQIAALKSAIRGYGPDIDLPEYDIKDIEFAMPADFDAKKAEGESLVRDLTAILHRLKSDAEVAHRQAMTSDERIAAQDAEIRDLRDRMKKFEALRPAAAGGADERVGRASRPRSEAPQMCMPTTGAVRPTNGWFGAPTGVMAGNVRLLRRGTGAARNAHARKPAPQGDASLARLRTDHDFRCTYARAAEISASRRYDQRVWRDVDEGHCHRLCRCSRHLHDATEQLGADQND
jgi:hypothetical protein